ncbi:molybdopterin synthase catalytic subunit [Stratiformator vulcanicus]|uniref:Molybdopterin synthase catalytic subunit n=1 Tax=Stratiformator vulcanicus TaxID=2527980 RepID=A0A517QWB4_9PLAN|nr:molybdenum cofactor biosynthesis protein MoaE [Stratiformator vulcanicus]QDT35868.1 Molybdopterin synthase catalytic subunit [Stratiformator vulcanicus]
MSERASELQIKLTPGPIECHDPLRIAGAGAVLTFEGIVRPHEGEREIDGLLYEVYEPMTSRELRRLAEELMATHDIIGCFVEHSVGFVPHGECSFLLQAAAAHRPNALAFIAVFIDRMKQHVPIWKVPQYRGTETE